MNCLGCVAPTSPWSQCLDRAELRDRGAGEGTEHAPQCSAVLYFATAESLAVVCIPSTVRWPGKGGRLCLMIPMQARKEFQSEGRELVGHSGSLTQALWALTVNTAML